MTADLKALSRRVMAMNIANTTPDPIAQRDAQRRMSLRQKLLLTVGWGALLAFIVMAVIFGEPM